MDGSFPCSSPCSRDASRSIRRSAAHSASALYNDAVAMTTNAETTARARTSILFSVVKGVVVVVVVVKVLVLLPDDKDDDIILSVSQSCLMITRWGDICFFTSLFLKTRRGVVVFLEVKKSECCPTPTADFPPSVSQRAGGALSVDRVSI